MDHRLHHRLHHLTAKPPPRHPLRSEQDAFVFLVWVGGVALVVALAAKFLGAVVGIPVLVVGVLAIARFYFEVGGPTRRRRQRRRQAKRRGGGST